MIEPESPDDHFRAFCADKSGERGKNRGLQKKIAYATIYAVLMRGDFVPVFFMEKSRKHYGLRWCILRFLQNASSFRNILIFTYGSLHCFV